MPTPTPAIKATADLPTPAAYGVKSRDGFDPDDKHKLLIGLSLQPCGSHMKEMEVELFTADQVRNCIRAALATPAIQAVAPIPWKDIVKAIRAVDDEAYERGRMFPQTADEQREDRDAAKRVIGMIEWYATEGGAVAERLPNWPGVNLAAVPAQQPTNSQSGSIRPSAEPAMQLSSGSTTPIRFKVDYTLGNFERTGIEVTGYEFKIEGATGHRFAVHKSLDDKSMYCATHIETGFAAGRGETPEAAIEIARMNWTTCDKESLSLKLMRARNTTGVKRAAAATAEQPSAPVPRVGGDTKPSCETCNDNGVIGGFVGGAAPGYDSVNCPDCSAPAAPVAPDREEFIRQVLLAVAEIPDRDSPEDQPEMMLVTDSELRNILISAFESADEEAPVAPDLSSLKHYEHTAKDSDNWPGYTSEMYECSGEGYFLAADVERLLSHSAQAPVEPTNDMRDAYVGAREDLLDWKNRALRAEDSCRRMTAALNAENGPTFMGGPVEPVSALTDEQRLSLTLAAATFDALGIAGSENLRALLAASPKVEPTQEGK